MEIEKLKESSKKLYKAGFDDGVKFATNNQWISLKDKIPDGKYLNKWVIGITNKGEILGVKEKRNPCNPDYYGLYDINDNHILDISYWMPIPEINIENLIK
jgi:hypothetical protein